MCDVLLPKPGMGGGKSGDNGRVCVWLCDLFAAKRGGKNSIAHAPSRRLTKFRQRRGLFGRKQVSGTVA